MFSERERRTHTPQPRDTQGVATAEKDLIDSTLRQTNAPAHTVTAASRRKALIIGAGLGGLSAGIHLQRDGWDVTLIERNSRVGGRMNVIEEDGFRIDMGPTMLMMPHVLRDLFASCGRDVEDYLTLERLRPAYRVCWPDGTYLDMGCSMEEILESVRTFAPEDVVRFPGFITKMQDKYENARYNFIEKSFNSVSSLLRPSTLKGLVKSLPVESVYSFVAKQIRNEKLRQAFTFQTMYLGLSPFECPSIYALLPYIEMEYGVWFPEGGMISVANALGRLFNELGGKVELCKPVEKILLDGKTAVGIRTADGAERRADVVVCNMDLPMAYSRLLPADIRRKNTDTALEKRDYGCSGYLLYLGVRDLECAWGQNIILLSDSYKMLLDDICEGGCAPRDPAMHVCIPTRTDPGLAPHGHDVVYVLVPCPNTQGGLDWNREAPLLRERVLQKLEAVGMPGLREKIVFEREFTPPEFETLYGCFAGSAYGGLAHTFMQSAYFRPHSRSEDVKNLYFVGASTHPGGGVPIVLTSGRLVSEEIAADVRR